jgi:hypothetical protein
MKKIVANVLSMMAFVFVLTAAGYSQQLILKADVPFEFSVGKKTFPAGAYTVVRIADHTLSLRDENGGFLVSVVTQPVMSNFSHSNPKLRFENKGNGYVLTQVWPDNAFSGYELFNASKKFTGYAENQPAGQGLQTAAAITNEK